MSAKPKPRRLYSCPRCGELVVRVYTGAQFGQPLSSLVAEYRGVEQSAQLGFSAPLNGFRAKGFQHALLLPTQDDLAVSCTKCGRKFSMLVDEVFNDVQARNAPQRRPLPTRTPPTTEG